MEAGKKPWSTPSLTVHGDVEQITGADNEVNADTPAGNANTAYPVSPAS